MNMETVCAVVVTYNRKELLIECLEALKKQTRPLQAIYLIDNASTDGTPELLIEKGYIKELPPKNLKEPWEKEAELKNLVNEQSIKLHYVRMNENTGGAGGFYEGIKRAYEKDYDWLWLMDDDVEPKEDALEKQLSYSNISKCIHPNRYYLNGEEVLWEGYIDEFTGMRVSLRNSSFKYKDFCCVNIGCFEGMLIHREIIAKIGYPDKRFFIVYDDEVYGFMASKFTNVLFVKNANFLKKIKKENVLTEFSAYYFIKNFPLRNRYIERFAEKKYSKIRKIFYKVFLIRLMYQVFRVLGVNKGIKILYKVRKESVKIANML